MTDYIDGKRYKITVTGEYRKYGHDLVLARGDGYHFKLDALKYAHHSAVTVELLPDPLPTTPGSVIRHEDVTYIHTEDYKEPVWLNPWRDYVHGSELLGATVLFDAGAA